MSVPPIDKPDDCLNFYISGSAPNIADYINNFQEKSSVYNYTGVETSRYFRPIDYNRATSAIRCLYDVLSGNVLSGSYDMTDYTTGLASYVSSHIINDYTDVNYLPKENPVGNGTFKFDGNASITGILDVTDTISANTLKALNDINAANIQGTSLIKSYGDIEADKSVRTDKSYANYVEVQNEIRASSYLLLDGTSPFSMSQTIYNSYFNDININRDSNPPGTIIWWGGDANNIPSGYVICDGTEYTITPETIDNNQIKTIKVKYKGVLESVDITQFYSNCSNNAHLFTITDSSEKFITPNLLDKFIKGVSNTEDWSGAELEAGLPNISGSFYGIDPADGSSWRQPIWCFLSMGL